MYVTYILSRHKTGLERELSEISEKVKREDSLTDGRIIEEEHAQVGTVRNNSTIKLNWYKTYIIPRSKGNI